MPTILLDTCVLGGGFGGVYCGKELAAAVRRKKLGKVGLVAAENHMVFQPMLPEVAAGALSPRHVVNPLRQLCRGLQVFKGEVYRIDPQARELFLQAGNFTPHVRIRFRNLVLALGAHVDLSRVPGMTEHALLIQNAGDAMRIRATVISRFEEANLVSDPLLQRRLLSFVVVGGGYSGVETAGGLLDMVHSVRPFYENVLPASGTVHLIHSRDHLLPTLDRRLGEYTFRLLERKGMNIRLNKRVQSMTSRAVTLSDESVIESATVISTVGNAPHPLVMDFAKRLELPTEKGRLRTNPTGKLPGPEGFWACGDCAAFPMPDGNTSPPTAQFAQRQGTLVGRNLLAENTGRPLKRFRFAGLGELAAIGHRKAVGEVFGIRVSGFPAWWLWRTVYLGKLPGLQRKLQVAAEWSFELFFQRDINLLNPRYSKILKEIFLDPGMVLFHPGDPAFSLYFVQNGSVEIRDGDNIVKTVGAGDYFGERALLDDRTWHFEARAAETTRLVALGAPEFEAILRSSNALEQLFRRSAKSYIATETLDQLKERIPPERLQSKVESIMNADLHPIPLNASLPEAMEILRRFRHGSYPVIDAAGKLHGILRRDDLYDQLKRASDPASVTVADMPLSSLPTTTPDANVERVFDLLLRSGKNKACVIDPHANTLAGLVTVADLLEATA
ncbi:MAG: FAD-dependent oxidoreductase [Verrucomicrobia bacterium]|jgi:NADH dehydrogenase|nr:FAD-dependent oxidoreductase [Verrucomicrobiota bacterium]